MAVQPTGTVTLLLTDVEGSTRLLDGLGAERYSSVLELHRRLLREAFARRGGYEVDEEGDALFVVFAGAGDAVGAAADGQRALAAAEWPEGCDGLRVRMGVHTGEPLAVPPKYVGMDVHRAARIMSAAHGGQVLVSETTAALLDGVPIRDLGAHRLKDMLAPIRLHQLEIEGLPGEFPPLRSLHQTNLPVAAWPLLGREHELEAIGSLVSEGVRLLTLTGPGGSGKTRLALQAAADLSERFADGVFFVALAPVREIESMPGRVAEAVGLEPDDDVAAWLASKRVLLVLDNLEHLPGVDSIVVELLVGETVILATSRTPLHLMAERELLVEPLAEEAAVELFVSRAAAAGRILEVDETIEAVCRRLDHLPLALELAAARSKLLSPAALLERLDAALPLLTSTASDRPERQRTLRATIEWSHDLLTGPERQLFARLSVFAGGCTLEAAEQIADADLDTLQSLLEKSLIQRTGERYWMLQTISEYAAGRLDDETRLCHAEWFLAFAEQAEPELSGAAQAAWLGRLDTEHDNVRASLAFLHRSGRTGLEIRLAGALWRYWSSRGFLREGRDRLEAILAAAGGAFAVEHEKILQGGTSFALELGDYDRAGELAAKRLAISRAQADPTLIANSLLGVGLVADATGEHERASVLYTEAADLAREQGDKLILALTLNNLGYLAMRQGDDQTARTRLEEALALFRGLSVTHSSTRSLLSLSGVARKQGRIDEAYALGHEALILAHDLGDTLVIIWCLEWHSEQAALDGQADRAARLLGASDAIRENIEHEPYPEEQQQMELITTLLDAHLDQETLAAARAEGRGMTLDEAVAYALQPAD